MLFEGEFKNNEYNGKGKYYENNILKLDGIFKDNEIINGKLYLANKTYYIGNFKDYKPNGKGKIFDENEKLIYEGDFIDGEFEGKGKQIFDFGYYEGEFKNDDYNGKGKYYENNILKLDGIFKDNEIIKGKLYLTNKTYILYRKF